MLYIITTVFNNFLKKLLLSLVEKDIIEPKQNNHASRGIF